MPVCRIYLFTYKRNDLLKRAIKSLIDQTFTDWICELHNDLPGDPFPREFINSLNDPRFTIKDHPVNLGPTASFNLAYSGCEEKYASILEDDNWWEPDFLKEMIKIMEANNQLDICWSNMKMWQEQPDSTWTDTGKTIWPVGNDRSFTWPQPKQALGALHSNGAMLYRGSKANNYQIPPNALFNSVEMIRERSFEYPIFLSSNTLANFSLTQITNQSNSIVEWAGTQTMLLASYIQASNNPQAEFKKLLQQYRISKPSPVSTFFLAACFCLKKPALLINFNVNDWYKITRWCAVNITKIGAIKKYLNKQANTWDHLKAHTKQFESV